MKIVCIDTEHSTGAFRPWEQGFYLTCVGIVTVVARKDRKEELIWFDHRDVESTVEGLKRIQDVIDEADLLVFHNAKHDICVLAGFGIDFKDTKLWCTMIVDYLIEGQNKELKWSLNAVAERYELGQKDDKVREFWNEGIDTYDIPDDILGPYCLDDCNLTLDIYEKQVPRVEEADLWRVVDLQNEYTYVLADMETNGLLIDAGVSMKVIQYHTERMKHYKNKILGAVPGCEKVNLSSPQQLSAFLYGGLLKLSWKEWAIKEYTSVPYSRYYEKTITEERQFPGIGFKPQQRDKKDDGYYKVDKDTIIKLSSPKAEQRKFKKLLVKYSKHAKVISTLQGRKGDKGLLAKVQPDKCIHPSLNQTIAATGRLTSSNPNGQNLPRGNTSPIKTCIISRADGIMQVDLSQVEWRDAAWLAQDKVMIDEINAGVDQHIATVKELMEMPFISKKDPESKKNRDTAKIFNFRMIFGGTEWGYYLDVNMPNFSIVKWKKLIKNFWIKYRGLADFHAANIKFVYRHGYIKIPTGRWFKFNKRNLKGGEYGYGTNQIRNYPIQGMSGGDILPLLAVIIRRGMRKMGLQSKLILTVHDSIVFDYVDEERNKLTRLCYNVGNSLDSYIRNYYKINWNVKLEVEVEAGPSYGELKYIPQEEVGL